MTRGMPMAGHEPFLFTDRPHAGEMLALRLAHLRAADPLVLALPRGGVPVAAVVAEALDAPLDVVVVRKLALPSRPELALGALTWDGVRALNAEVVAALRVPEERVLRLAAVQAQEVARRTQIYRGRIPLPDVRDRTVVLVDDGVATGATVRAAIAWLRPRGPRRLVLAVPVIAADAEHELASIVDEVVAVRATGNLLAVGAWYEDFEQVPDAEVVRLLEEARRRSA